MGAGGADGKAVGALLRQARRAAGMTQEELAEKTGVSVRALGDLERGLTERPHRKSLELLADALGLPEPARAQVLGMSRWPRGAGAGASQGHGDMLRPGSSWVGPGAAAPEPAGPAWPAVGGPSGAAG